MRKCDRTPVLTGMMRRLLIEGRQAEAREFLTALVRTREVLNVLILALDEHGRPDYEMRCNAFQGLLMIDHPSMYETPNTADAGAGPSLSARCLPSLRGRQT